MGVRWLLLFVPLLVHADIEEVVVVAEKRQTTERNVAMSLDVLGGEEMLRRQILDGDDIQDTAPNLALNQKSAIKSGLAIRGIGTDSFHISGQESVGSFLDEVALVSPFVSQIALWDMDHLEVLRGPQNSLYGRNTIGGAVNYLTRQADPNAALNGSVQASTGSGADRRLEAAVGMRVANTFAFRISGIDESKDGEWRNLATGKDYGGLKRNGFRVNTRWRVQAQTDLRFSYMQADMRVESLPQVWLGDLDETGQGNCPVQGVSAVGGRNTCTTRINQSQLDGSSYLTQAFAQGNTSLLAADPLQPGTYLVNYSAPWGDTWQDPAASLASSQLELSAIHFKHEYQVMTLHSVTSHLKYDVDAKFSSDLHSFASAQLGQWDIWQQELRLASSGDGNEKLKWLIGAYVALQDSEEDTIVLRTDRGIAPGILIDNRFRNYSLFGQVDYQLSRSLLLTVGLRHSKEVLEARRYEKWACNTSARADDYLTNFPPAKLGGLQSNGLSEINRLNRAVIESECSDISFGPIPTLRFSANTRSEILDLQEQHLSETGWNARLAWRGTRNQILFFTASNSFKGGAYDNRALGDGSAPIDPEYLTAIEIGYKDQFFEGQLTIDAALFKYRWDDQQLFEVVAGNPQTLNIKETDILGAELNLEWWMSENWSSGVALGLLDSEITGLSDNHPAASLAAVGNEITNAPNYTAHMFIRYGANWMNGRFDMEFRSRYVGPQYLLISNSRGSELSSYRMLDASIGYQFGSEQQYSIRLAGNNLTETRSYSRIAGGPGEFAWNVLGSGMKHYTLQLGAEF
tara:strand:- start:398 stop:2803 length:2406 start_codon:yes stop_codon:yes gene_type:complete